MATTVSEFFARLVALSLSAFFVAAAWGKPTNGAGVRRPIVGVLGAIHTHKYIYIYIYVYRQTTDRGTPTAVLCLNCSNAIQKVDSNAIRV